jgi:hypothetical protein
MFARSRAAMFLKMLDSKLRFSCLSHYFLPRVCQIRDHFLLLNLHFLTSYDSTRNIVIKLSVYVALEAREYLLERRAYLFI